MGGLQAKWGHRDLESSGVETTQGKQGSTRLLEQESRMVKTKRANQAAHVGSCALRQDN